MAPPKGYHEITAPATSAPPNGYHEIASPSDASPTVAAGPQMSPISQAISGMPNVGDILRNLPSSLKAFGSDVKGMAQYPSAQNPYAGMGQEQKGEAVQRAQTEDIFRQQAGYSRPYRAVAPVAESLGVNVPGMEEAASGGDSGAIYGHAAAGLVPWLATKGGIRGSQDVATMAAIKGARSDINEMSHNWLFNSSGEAKQFVKGTQQGVEAHVGLLKQGLETADKATMRTGQMGTVNLSDLAPEIDRISQKYKGPLEIPLDKFDRAVNSFNVISGKSPYVDLETLLDIRTGIGKLWHSARDSMDAAATAELRDVLTNKAKDRTAELGQSAQFNSYNKVWKNLLEYEDQGVLGKLLNTQSGKPFFDLLNSKELGPQLRQLNKDLSEQAGTSPNGRPVFPPDYFKKLAEDHKAIYDYTQRKGGIRGVFSNIGRNLPVGLGGAFGGGLAGAAIGHPYVGALGGANVALSLADRLAAIRNMSKLGGAASIEGRMGPRVEPDFGGGLSGQVIKELEKGPQSRKGGTQGSLVSSPEEIQRMQQEDRPESVNDIVDRVERTRREKAIREWPVGQTSREVDAKLGLPGSEQNVQAQIDQADVLKRFVADMQKADPTERTKMIKDLQDAMSRKGKKK